MRLPDKLEAMCKQLREHKDIPEEHAIAMRMAVEAGYMFGLTEAHAAAKVSLHALESLIGTAAISSLDTMRSMFEDMVKKRDEATS